MKLDLATIKYALTDERAFQQFAASRPLRYSVGAFLAAVAVGLGWSATTTRGVADTTFGVVSLALGVTLGMAAVFCFFEFTEPLLKVSGWIGLLILLGLIVIVTLGISSLLPVSLAVIAGAVIIGVAIGRKES